MSPQLIEMPVVFVPYGQQSTCPFSKARWQCAHPGEISTTGAWTQGVKLP